MNELYNQVATYVQGQLTNNDILVGIIGGGLLSSLYWIGPFFWKKIILIFNYFFCFSVVLKNEDRDSYNKVREYFSGIFKNSRRVRLDKKNKYILSFGSYYKLRWFHLIYINLSEEEQQNSLEIKESLGIKIYGFRSKNIFEKHLKLIKEKTKKEQKTFRNIYNNHWNAKDKPKNSVESLHYKNDITNKVIKDIDKFINNKKIYQQLGIPYKRGYMFYGDPGTGKTSLAYALANHYNRDIFVLDCETISSKSCFKNAAYQIWTNNPIILIDDIDCIKSSMDRESGKDFDEEKITKLSTIFEFLDGQNLPNGTIIIATTNHYKKLDPALVREGRFDKKFEFELADRNVAEKMLDSFDLPHSLVDNAEFPMSQAKLQSIILPEVIE